MTKQEYNIVRRAYSQRTIAEQFIGTWVDAALHAMKVEADRRDGEYSAIPAEHGLQYPDDGGVDQSTLSIAWV